MVQGARQNCLRENIFQTILVREKLKNLPINMQTKFVLLIRTNNAYFVNKVSRSNDFRYLNRLEIGSCVVLPKNC